MTIHSRVSQIRLKKKFPLMFNLKHLFCDLSHCISASICSENRIWWLPLVLNQFSSVMSDSLQTHGLQHARPPCLPPIPGVYSNSCPLSQWCHPTISSSVIPFSSRLQSFPASGYFPMSWLFTSGGQNIGISALVFPMNIQDWFPLGLTGWHVCSPRDSQESSPAPQFESINSLVLSFLYGPKPYLYMTTGKAVTLTMHTFVCKVISLLF